MLCTSSAEYMETQRKVNTHVCIETVARGDVLHDLVRSQLMEVQKPEVEILKS